MLCSTFPHEHSCKVLSPKGSSNSRQEAVLKDWKHLLFASADSHGGIICICSIPSCLCLLILQSQSQHNPLPLHIAYQVAKQLRSMLTSVSCSALRQALQPYRDHSTGRARRILTSVVGRSLASVCTLPRRLMTLMPLHTLPKIVCLPSSHGVGARVTKNCKDNSNQKTVRIPLDHSKGTLASTDIAPAHALQQEFQEKAVNS
jgi:hypothetical protein